MVDDSKPFLYRLFAESKAITGVSSTAMIEGLVFGLNAYVIDTFSAETMKSFVEWGLMKVVTSASDLVKHLESIGASPTPRGDVYFNQGATKRITRYLENLVYKRHLSAWIPEQDRLSIGHLTCKAQKKS